jgi:primary-amine oxidase
MVKSLPATAIDFGKLFKPYVLLGDQKSVLADPNTRRTIIDMAIHPLDPATPEEILEATAFVKQAYNGLDLQFRAGGLQEPPKALLLDYLESERTGHEPPATVPRWVYLTWYIKRTPRLFEAVVDITNGVFVRHVELPRDIHGPISPAEMDDVTAVVLADNNVRNEVGRLGVEISTVVPDPWDYGVDGEDTQARRVQVPNSTRSLSNMCMLTHE